MSTDTARHYAEKVRDALRAIEEADVRTIDALITTRDFDSTKHEISAREARGLRASLLLHAANLAEAVLAETTPTPFTRCGAEFAGHVCGLLKAHAGQHEDARTLQTWT